MSEIKKLIKIQNEMKNFFFKEIKKEIFCAESACAFSFFVVVVALNSKRQ